MYSETNIRELKLKELIKGYHIFKAFDPQKADEYLTLINKNRLQTAILAEQRQNFYDQITVVGNTAGSKEDHAYTRDDINFIVNRFVASLGTSSLISLLHRGLQREIITRQAVQWQQIMSDVQIGTAGQLIPFDLPEEIYFEKNQALNIGIIGQSETGYIFPHGCNLKDDYSPNIGDLTSEIEETLPDGNPNIPQPRIVPLLFKFTAASSGNKAIGADGNSKILNIKVDESVLLTEVSTTSINSRITIIDRGRNQTWCNEVESLGVAGLYTNQYTVYYPLPYPHLLRKGDRLEIKVLNGSAITSAVDSADVTQFLTFRGRTI